MSELDFMLAGAVAVRRAARQYRERRMVRVIDSTHVEIDGRRVINFASNDYLGLTHHPAVVVTAQAGADSYGAGSGAAALITGYSTAHAEAEAAIALWKGTQAAVLLPSGYQANHAAVQTLVAAAEAGGAGEAAGAGKGVRFLVDKLAHASLIDAVRGSGARFRVFSHNQLGKLRRLLEEREAGQLQVVVSESIFSMDGDAADLQGLAALKRQQPFALLLDEAHASGVYGKHGAGYAAERGLAGIADVSVITLSKAMGCMGGAVCASSAFVETLVNYAPAFIFSTNISPMMAAGAKAAIGVMREEPGRQERVRALALRVRREWEGLGCEIPAGDSPIIPLILGTEGRALAAAEKLRERGMIVPAVRPPSVPRNGSRLRVTLCCEHRDEEVELLIKAVREEIAGS